MSRKTLNRIFLARLAGAAVFDPNGDPVGKVRDAVATLRTNNARPRILGDVATHDFIRSELSDLANEIETKLGIQTKPNAD